MLNIIWRTLVVFHFILIITNFLSIFVLPFATPWYIAAPMITLIVNLTFSPLPCPLTTWENRLRVKLGLPKIKYFIGHYILGKKYEETINASNSRGT